ncbi:putative NmrA-like family domain-containing protein 1 [Amylocarpus encephaloides]|uniref:NmrA-like family domain-containing protein 1 n=1 Tax=Amylocarpus encephaloides TaxID=45428 RepID=A0A9P8C636_9HELO|nr:putative NmrA-like family domain-containing protein 1 [Amylocarpus encephaloides]
MTTKNILITGSTGNQGSAVVNALLMLSNSQVPYHLYTLTRNPSSAPARRLTAKPNVTVIQGDSTNPQAIFSQLPPDIHGLFLVTLPNATEKEQAIPLIDIAIEKGVRHIVFTSADRGGPERSETDATIIPHFGTKMGIEKSLKEACSRSHKSTEWTILRPTSFMDNISPSFIGKTLGTMLKQMGDTKLSLISVSDIGKAAALAFDQPARYSGRALTLTGDWLTFDEMDLVFKEETGAGLPTTFEVVANGLQWGISDLNVSMRYFREGGYAYEMDGGLARELGLKDFRTWLREDSKFPLLI